MNHIDNLNAPPPGHAIVTTALVQAATGCPATHLFTQPNLMLMKSHQTTTPLETFGEANNNHAAKPTQTENHAELPENAPPRDSIDTKSEEKSEPNSNDWTNNPDCLLSSNLVNLELKP